MRLRFVQIVLISMALSAGMAPAVDLRLEGSLLSLDAELSPLREVLMAFTYAGVAVRMDPSIDFIVSTHRKDEDIEMALREILDPLGYALIWDVVEGPVGPFPRLAEIQVFRPGEKENIVPLEDPNTSHRVTRGADMKGPLYVENELLLSVKKGTTLADFKRLIAQLGGTVDGCCAELGVYRIRFMPGANIPAFVDQLQDNPMVHTAEPNYVYEVPTPTVVDSGAQVFGEVETLATPSSGIPAVAILDSGLGAVDGLANVVIGKLDAVNPESPLTDPLGHGTQMALIAAGAVSPRGVGVDESSIPIVAIRAFDDQGRASNFSLMRSITYALGQGSRVLNMSWGSETDSRFLANAIAYARSKGLAVVAAVGNEPTRRPMYPAAYPGVVGVSATAPSGQLWDRSNSGSFVTLAAPGYASFPVGYKGPPGSYAGTSIASAYVSRALGLYFSRHPGATAKEAVTALQNALTDAGSKGKDSQYGYGVLDDDALRRFLATD